MPDDHYIARPESGSGKGVLVLHAWWGLNRFCKELCDRLTREGFVALAPDLYHGATASTVEEARKLRSNLDPDVVLREIEESAGRLRTLCEFGDHGIGVLGLSMGGYWALRLAEQPQGPVNATVVFYSVRKGDYSQSRSAFQFHIAGTDEFVPAPLVQELQEHLSARGKTAEVHTYPDTSHWFFEDDRTDAYRQQAATAAWDRTAVFLKKYV